MVFGHRLSDCLFKEYATAMLSRYQYMDQEMDNVVDVNYSGFYVQPTPANARDENIGLRVAIRNLELMGFYKDTYTKENNLEVKLKMFVEQDSRSYKSDDFFSSEHDFAALIIFKDGIALDKELFGETKRFTYLGCEQLFSTVIFRDCRLHKIRFLQKSFCGIFKLSLKEFGIPLQYSPWGFLRVHSSLEFKLSLWPDSLKRCIIPLDHYYPTGVAGLKGEDMLVGRLLDAAGGGKFKMHLCNMNMADHLDPPRYRLEGWVSTDDSPSSDEILDFDDRTRGRESISVIVIWPIIGQSTVQKMGLCRFVQNVPTKLGAPGAVDCLKDILGFYHEFPEFFTNKDIEDGEDSPDESGDDHDNKPGICNYCDYHGIYHSKVEIICKVLDLFIGVGNRQKCQDIVEIVGKSQGIPSSEVVNKLISMEEKHDQILEHKLYFLMTESRVVKQAINYAALAFALHNRFGTDFPERTSPFIVAKKTFKLVMEGSVLQQLGEISWEQVRLMVRDLLDGKCYVNLLMKRGGINLVVEIIFSENNWNIDILHDKLWMNTNRDELATLVSNLVMRENEELLKVVCRKVKQQSRDEANQYRDTTLTEELLENSDVWEAAKEKRMIAEAIHDIGSDWIAYIGNESEPEFSWRQPMARMPSCPKLEEFLRGPLEKIYHKLERPSDLEVINLKNAESSFKLYGVSFDGTLQEGASAKVEIAGKTRGTVVLISKTRTSFEAFCKLWKQREKNVKRICARLPTIGKH